MTRFYFYLIMMAGFTCASQTVKLVPFNKSGSWGFSDFNKNIKISCTYDHVDPFKFGMAICEKDNKACCIDKNNKIIIDFIYDGLEIEAANILLAVKNEKVGLIDAKGKILLPLIYDNIEFFNENLFIAKDSLEIKYLVDLSGNIKCSATNFDYDARLYLIAVESKINDSLTYTGMLDGDGNSFIPVESQEFKEVFLNKKAKESEKMIEKGLKKQKMLSKIIPNDFVFYINRNGKYGIINGAGKTIIPFEYDEISQKVFENKGLYLAHKNDQYYFLDAFGKVIHNLIVDSINDNADRDRPLEIFYKGKMGVLNENFYPIAAPLFDDIASEKYTNLVIAGLNNRGTLITKPTLDTNNLIWFDGFDELDNFARSGWGSVTKNGMQGIMDSTGKMIVDCKYKNTYVEENYATFRTTDNKRGALNKKGKIILPAVYDYVLAMCSLKENSFIVRNADSVYLLNKKQKTFLFTMGEDETISTHREFFDKKDFYWTYYDENEHLKINKVVGNAFTRVFRQDLFLDTEDNTDGSGIYRANDTIYILDKFGNKLINAPLKEAINYTDEIDYKLPFYYASDFNGNSGMINKQGKIIIPFTEEKNIDFNTDYCGDTEILLYMRNGKQQIYNPNDQSFSKLKFTEYIVSDAINFMVVGNENKEYGLLRADGKTVTDYNYSELNLIDDQYGSPIYVGKDKTTGLMGAIDTSGKIIVPFNFKQVNSNSDLEGIIVALDQNDNQALFTVDGKNILQAKYKELNILYSDMFTVTDPDSTTLVYDIEGNCLTKIKAPNIEVSMHGEIGGKEFVLLSFDKENGENVKAYVDEEGTIFYSE